jgi:hypothetical protein
MHRITHHRLNFSPLADPCQCVWPLLRSPDLIQAILCWALTGFAEVSDNPLHLPGTTQAISLNGSGSDP